MINNELELFSAHAAAQAGLIDAIKNGTAIVSGSYKLMRDGTVDFAKNNFVFKDKYDNLRVGNFENDVELLTFFELFGEKINADTDKQANIGIV